MLGGVPSSIKYEIRFLQKENGDKKISAFFFFPQLVKSLGLLTMKFCDWLDTCKVHHQVP